MRQFFIIRRAPHWLGRLLPQASLAQPRLLPATILLLCAVLALKSVILVQAAAQEAGGAKPESAQAEPAKPVAKQAAKAPAVAAPVAPPPVPVAVPAGPPPISEAERSVLLDLRKRRDALEARAHALDQREAEFAAAERRLNDRVQQLASLQARLEALEADRQQHRAENWAGLVKIYETMKPRDAAAIFDALDMQVLLQVLDRMQERRVAPILASMQPDRARLATQLLAEMRTRALTPAAPQPGTAPESPTPSNSKS